MGILNRRKVQKPHAPTYCTKCKGEYFGSPEKGLYWLELHSCVPPAKIPTVPCKSCVKQVSPSVTTEGYCPECVRLIREKQMLDNMTAYEQGYAHGVRGWRKTNGIAAYEEWQMGYHDGKGDRTIALEAPSEHG